MSMVNQQNPQAAFEQSVKALGEWLSFLKTRESEYVLQMERAKKAAPAELADTTMVEIEQEDGIRPSFAEEKYSQGIDPFTDNGTDVNTNETDKHEAWL